MHKAVILSGILSFYQAKPSIFFPGKEKLNEKYKQEPKLSFVIKAIYTMAYGLHDMVQDVCGRGGTGLCPDLFPFNGSLFKVRDFETFFSYAREKFFENNFFFLELFAECFFYLRRRRTSRIRSKRRSTRKVGRYIIFKGGKTHWKRKFHSSCFVF